MIERVGAPIDQFSRGNEIHLFTCQWALTLKAYAKSIDSDYGLALTGVEWDNYNYNIL